MFKETIHKLLTVTFIPDPHWNWKNITQTFPGDESSTSGEEDFPDGLDLYTESVYSESNAIESLYQDTQSSYGESLYSESLEQDNQSYYEESNMSETSDIDTDDFDCTSDIDQDDESSYVASNISECYELDNETDIESTKEVNSIPCSDECNHVQFIEDDHGHIAYASIHEENQNRHNPVRNLRDGNININFKSRNLTEHTPRQLVKYVEQNRHPSSIQLGNRQNPGQGSRVRTLDLTNSSYCNKPWTNNLIILVKLLTHTQFQTITYLYLNKCGLEKFPPEIFNFFQRIKCLHARGNRLKEINEEFKNFQDLEELNLSRNKICNITDKIQFIPNLRKLNIAGNPVYEIPALLVNCHKLKYITAGSISTRIIAPELLERIAHGFLFITVPNVYKKHLLYPTHEELSSKEYEKLIPRYKQDLSKKKAKLGDCIGMLLVLLTECSLVLHKGLLQLPLKANRLHPRNYPHTPTDYRQTDNHLRLLTVVVAPCCTRQSRAPNIDRCTAEI